jgi:hypothetical protein
MGMDAKLAYTYGNFSKKANPFFVIEVTIE